MSQWSFDKSRARSADNAPAISVPALVIENGADDAAPASHPRKIFELLGSSNKRFERIDVKVSVMKENTKSACLNAFHTTVDLPVLLFQFP